MRFVPWRCARVRRRVVACDDGGVPKRSNGADCKSVGAAFAGSNPAPSTKEVSPTRSSGVSHAAGWSSLVARRAHNPKVVGSNPAPATKVAASIDEAAAAGPHSSVGRVRPW